MKRSSRKRPVSAPHFVPSPVSPPPLKALSRGFPANREAFFLFVFSFCVLMGFSGTRFLRQSAAPHFVYQAQSWLDGRLDLDPKVLPNLEDWACVREEGGEKRRCEWPARSTDRWYVSFPSWPAVVMLPFVWIQGYAFNDTSLGVFVGALAVALFYSLLRHLRQEGEAPPRPPLEDVLCALVFGFGTLFFYCAIRGEVWFVAEVMGVALTCLYLRLALKARRPWGAGLVFSMATLTRTPLLFSGLFFVMEALRSEGWSPRQALSKVARFALGAAPLGLLAALFNLHRFGKLTEFGHSFLFNNRVNTDIDRYGLFHWIYLPRNLEAAFLKLPRISFHPFSLGYDPYGMSLLITMPLLVLIFVPRQKLAVQLSLWAAVAVCCLPGFLYQNTGYIQFGFRASLDYLPYLLVLFALSGWSLRRPSVMALALAGGVINTWGAWIFRGYTELVRGG